MLSGLQQMEGMAGRGRAKVNGVVHTFKGGFTGKVEKGTSHLPLPAAA